MKKDTRHDDAFDYPELDKMSAEDFYRIYRNFMYSIAKSERVDYGTADLAINDVMITIFMKHACHFDPQKSRFSNYLATMVRNACRNQKRREHRYVNFEAEELTRLSEENGAVTPENAYDADELRKWIREGIRILRKETRSKLMVDAFVMMVIDEERPKDIAKKLNVRPDYISLAKNRCLPRLRAIIREIMGK